MLGLLADNGDASGHSYDVIAGVGRWLGRLLVTDAFCELFASYTPPHRSHAPLLTQSTFWRMMFVMASRVYDLGMPGDRPRPPPAASCQDDRWWLSHPSTGSAMSDLAAPALALTRCAFPLLAVVHPSIAAVLIRASGQLAPCTTTGASQASCIAGISAS